MTLCTATVFFGGLFVLGGGVSWFLPAAESQTPSHNDSPAIVKVMPVRFESQFHVSRSYNGKVEPARESGLGFERGGLVVEIRCDEGDTVSQSQVLAVLDTSKLQAAKQEAAAMRDRLQAQLDEMTAGPRQETIDAAKANVDRWSAQAQLAELTGKRTEELYRRGSVTLQKRDEVRLSLESARAQLTASKERLQELQTGTRQEQIDAQKASVRQVNAQIESIDIDLEKSRLKAPFDGTVAQRFVDEGSVLNAGQPVVYLMETAHMEARIGIARSDVAMLARAQKTEIGINGETYPASIKAVLPQRDAQTRTVTVLFRIETGDAALRSGDLAEWTLQQQMQETGFWLPLTALTESVRGLWSCLVAEADENANGRYRLSRREVEILQTETDRAYVRGMVKEGELAVIDGVQKVVPNQLVQIVREG